MSNKSGKHGPIYHLPPLGSPPLSVQFLGVNYCDSDYVNIRRLARITVLGFVLSGQGRVSAGGQTALARQGDLFILPAGCYHEAAAASGPGREAQEPWSYIWLNVSGSWILRLLEAYRLLPHLVVSEAGLEDIFHEALEGAQTKTVEDMHGELQILLMRICVRLSETLRKRGEALSPTVHAIKQYLDNHVLQPFDSLRLAAHIGLSLKQINRLFKKELGTTIYNYVINKKIDSAKLMLLDTPLTIGAIGDQLGYGDPHYFSNLFFSKTGVRPSEFRKAVSAAQP